MVHRIRKDWYDPKRKFRKGQWVNYNVVDETGAYNVGGEIIRVHKDGTLDVQTASRIDRGVDPAMVQFGEKHPIGVIRLKKKR